MGACKRCDEAGDACAECYDAFGVVNGNCERCSDPRCARCDGSLDTCQDCSFDWEGSYETGAFVTAEGTCSECPGPNCAACEGPEGTCTACQRGHGLVKGQCKVWAEPGTPSARCDCWAGALSQREARGGAWSPVTRPLVLPPPPASQRCGNANCMSCDGNEKKCNE